MEQDLCKSDVGGAYLLGFSCGSFTKIVAKPWEEMYDSVYCSGINYLERFASLLQVI